MTGPTQNLYLASQVRAMDRFAIDEQGIPSYTLMTRAGDAAVEQIESHWPGAREWVALCGNGNNAGDALVVARRGLELGKAVRAILVRDSEQLTGDARQAYQDFVAAGGKSESFSGALPSGILIDGLLGTGIDRDVEGVYAEIIAAVNASDNPVLALDMPSGLSSDTGRVLGVAINADVTISFVGLKAGLFLTDGPTHAGEIHFADLGVAGLPEELQRPILHLSRETELAHWLPPRQKTAHKGDSGHVLVIGGGPGMPGAVRLCGEAALRAGAGLVSVATHPGHIEYFKDRPELMCHELQDTRALPSLIDKADVIALGPGLGRSDWARDVYAFAIECGQPMIVDADGLNLLAESPAKEEQRILTPHPGEAGRLLGTNTGAVQRDRIAAAKATQEAYGGVIVLKGSGSLTFDGQGAPWLCPYGNPGMAVAGMGDVLTGVIAGLAAQIGDLSVSARLGVLIHALAGDDAAGTQQRGLLASDLMSFIRQRVNPEC